jgi:hypothetical protein
MIYVGNLGMIAEKKVKESFGEIKKYALYLSK